MTYEILMLEAEETAVPSTRGRMMALPWIMAALFVLSFLVILLVLLYEPAPPSLYQPALAKKLTLAERQKLDMDLVNEVTMQTNSRRFDEPESFRQRAAWVEEEAKSYVVADLIQQIIKVAVARPRYNEKAFNRLVDLGASSYPAASCIAEKLYRFHVIEKTQGWKYSRDQVTAMALRAKKTDYHPVCQGIEFPLYFNGQLGYPKNLVLANEKLIEGALAGSFADQRFLAYSQKHPVRTSSAREVELELCWRRVADEFAPSSFLEDACFLYKNAALINSKVKRVEIDVGYEALAGKWCSKQLMVVAQDCANLERNLR